MNFCPNEANRMMESGGYLRSSGSPTLNRVEVVFSVYAGFRPGQARKRIFVAAL
jgi:hypothetical protein